ncbi:hypothetical protein pb186bvf_017130 [Paramecium bursaria]
MDGNQLNGQQAVQQIIKYQPSKGLGSYARICICDSRRTDIQGWIQI